MGVVNVTPDSFSDGGLHEDEDAAVRQGVALAEAGANLVDVGGESTRPGAAPVDAQEEAARVVPVIRRLAREVDVPISVDTYRASTAAAALDAGARIVNDISALRFDPELGRTATRAGAALVLMHCRGTPRDMPQGVEDAYEDVVTEVREGRPGDQIVAFVEENKTALVVMATHGRTGLRRTVLGSVADHVLRHLGEVPLLLVHPNED